MGILRRSAGLLALSLAVACNQVEVKPEVAPPTAALPAPEQAPLDAPDVLLITIDTLRPDHVGVYGAERAETPVLDGLARAGIRFDQAFASAPLTLPSHASMMTGLYPPRHGVRHNGVFRLRQDAETLAERFQAAGFETGAVVGAFVLSAQFGLAQGFDHYDDEFGERRSAGSGFQERPASEVTDRALAWLEGVRGPSFLWVHYYDPHADYKPPAPFDGRFADRPYDGEIAYVDREVGRLLEGLEARGRLANTHIAVTSDHGEGLGEHGESTHGYFLYDTVLRVPLILRGPGVPAGLRRSEPVSNTALAPTLAALAGLGGFEDSDTGSLLAPADAPPVHPYAETLATELDFGWAPLHAIRDARHALIQAPEPELYDVERDPGQQHNLLAGPAAESTSVHEELESRLAAILEAGRPVARTAIDSETAARMEALGYLVTTQPTRRTGMNPKDGQRWIELSMDALGAYFGQRFDEAREKALKVVAEFPDSGRMHGVLARIAVASGRPDEARPHAEALVRLQPESADHHSLLGLVHLKLGQLEAAVQSFEAGLALDGDHYGAHLGAMWKRKLGGSLEEADLHAARAIELAAGDVAILDRVAETWEGLGEYERALATYQRALAERPDSQHLHMRLAIQYARLDDRESFLRHVRQAGPAAARPDMRNRLGIALAARGAHREAEAIFRELLAQHPGNQLARLNLVRLLELTGRSEEAATIGSVPPLPGPQPPAAAGS